jgi:hypothetical protein
MDSYFIVCAKNIKALCHYYVTMPRLIVYITVQEQKKLEQKAVSLGITSNKLGQEAVLRVLNEPLAMTKRQIIVEALREAVDVFNAAP